jgi:hypothetical protein
MQSRFSRRSVLTLTGGSVVGLATGAQAQETHRVKPVLRQAEILSYRPLPPPSPGDGSRLSIEDIGGNQATIVATVPKLIYQNQPLIVTVSAVVPPSFVGDKQVMRVFMIEDSSEYVSGVGTSHIPITDAAFSMQVTAGAGNPLDDWYLTEERIFQVRASMNVVDQEAFAMSPDFTFKVRRVV